MHSKQDDAGEGEDLGGMGGRGGGVTRVKGDFIKNDRQSPLQVLSARKWCQVVPPRTHTWLDAHSVSTHTHAYIIFQPLCLHTPCTHSDTGASGSGVWQLCRELHWASIGVILTALSVSWVAAGSLPQQCCSRCDSQMLPCGFSVCETCQMWPSNGWG
jgi:hypothetical protein